MTTTSNPTTAEQFAAFASASPRVACPDCGARPLHTRSSKHADDCGFHEWNRTLSTPHRDWGRAIGDEERPATRGHATGDEERPANRSRAIGDEPTRTGNATPIAPRDAAADLATADAEHAELIAIGAGYEATVQRAARTRFILDGLLAFHAQADALWAASLDAIKLRREIAVVTARVQHDAFARATGGQPVEGRDFVRVPPLWS